MDNFTAKPLEDDRVCLKMPGCEYVLRREEIDKVFTAILPFTESVENLRADAGRLRWILDHPQTFDRMSERFAGDALLSLIDNEIAEREEFRND